MKIKETFQRIMWTFMHVSILEKDTINTDSFVCSFKSFIKQNKGGALHTCGAEG